MPRVAREAPAKSAAHLGNLLDGILGRLGLAHDLNGWRVVSGWPEIVGERIARESKAIRFEDDTLLVSVPDAVWRQQLSLEVEAILEKIHTYPHGRVVKRIHFVS